MNLTEYITDIRELTGVYMKDVVTDRIITRFVNEAQVAVLKAESWPFNEVIKYIDLPAGAQMIPTQTGVYRVNELVVQVGDRVRRALPTPSNLSRSARRQSLRSAYSTQPMYDVQAGAIEVWPPLDSDSIIGVRYVPPTIPLTSGTHIPTIPVDYHPMLSYRAATKVLNLMGDESDRLTFFAQEYSAYYDDMYSEYMLSSDMGAIPLSRTKDEDGEEV